MEKYVTTAYDEEGRHVVKDTETDQVVRGPYDFDTAQRVADVLNERNGSDEYELNDPKHPTFRERLASLWDSRPGK